MTFSGRERLASTSVYRLQSTLSNNVGNAAILLEAASVAGQRLSNRSKTGTTHFEINMTRLSNTDVAHVPF